MRRLVGEHKSATEVWGTLKAMRARRREPPPDLTTVRRLMKGCTHKVGVAEKRGRRAKLSRRSVLAMEKKRKELQKRSSGEYEVHWTDVVKKSRVPAVDVSPLVSATHALVWFV